MNCVEPQTNRWWGPANVGPQKAKEINATPTEKNLKRKTPSRETHRYNYRNPALRGYSTPYNQDCFFNSQFIPTHLYQTTYTVVKKNSTTDLTTSLLTGLE